jgi:hypothetical protein
MRFLEGNGDGDFSLTKDFVGDNIPEYAILSHTWGADTEEVTYRDLMENRLARITFNISGLIHVASTKRTTLSLQKPSTQCFAGIAMLLNATSIYQMFRDLPPILTITLAYCLGNGLFGKASGSRGAGPFKNSSPQRQLNSSPEMTSDWEIREL